MSYLTGGGAAEVTELESLDGPLLRSMTAVMAEAFRFDPMQEWLFPNERRRSARLRRAYELDVRHRLNGTATPVLCGQAGIAFWHPPTVDRLRSSTAVRVAPAYLSVAAHHPVRAPRVLREVLERRPPEPHWYLSHLAVDVGAQRAGIGRRLLDVGIRRADQDAIGVFLETANPANLAFYDAAGFRQVGIVRVPDVPPVWLLWRAPRSDGDGRDDL